MKLPLDSQKELFPLFPIDLWDGGAKFRFGHRIAMAGLKLSTLEGLKGTTYSQWEHRDAGKAEDFGTYTWHSTVAVDGDLMTIWSPPVFTAAELAAMTTAERARGRLLDRYFESRQHGFPAVLLDLQIEYSASAGSKARRNYQEDVAVSVPVEVSLYVTDVTPTESRVLCDEPIPGEIHGTFNGTEISFQSCLHPKIVMTSIAPTDATLIDCTPDRRSTAPGATRIFEATNFEYLEPHVFMMDVKKDQDLYFITEYKVFPPEDIPQIES